MRLRKASAFVVAFVAGGSALAQTATQPPPVVLTAVLMERYLVAQRDLAAATQAASEPGKPAISEEAAKSIMQKACNKAGFATVDACGDTIGYVGLLFSGFNPKTRVFERPADAARLRITELEADARMPAARKAALLAQNREVRDMASLAIPDADLALMNGFRDKILANGR